MKKLLIVLVTGFLLSACQQEQRYTQQSAEIDSVKSLFELYNSGDFDGQKAFYADTAKLFYNVPESKPSTIDQIISIQKEEVAPCSPNLPTCPRKMIPRASTPNAVVLGAGP